ncbi:NADH-quinone oxidoreductase subunit C [Streptomyces sp. NPDC054802]
MNAHPYDSLPDAVTEIFGEEATAERTYELLTVDVPAGSWIAALEIARDKLGCTYFDWLSAVDEPGTGFRVCAHVVSLEGRTVRRLLIRTTVPHAAPSLPSAVDVYAGASWHERETHEMFGVDFTGHPNQVPLLLPETFEGHPLRKDFVLAARVAKAWPGAKEPGEPEHGGPKRRQMLPPGVPDPNEWGPLKGQLPPAPARPARGRAAAAGAGAGAAGTGERPARRARSVSEGSASQSPATPRRARSASEGSASQADSAAPSGPAAPSAPAGATDAARPQAGPRSADAPWHHARPAFGETGTEAPVDPGASTGETGSAGTGAEGPAPAPDAAGEDDASASEVSVSEAPAPGPDDASASDDAPASERGASRPETDRPASGSDDGPDDEPNRPAGGEPA